MSNNDNNAAKGAEQRPEEEKTEQAGLRPRQNEETEKTAQPTAPDQQQPQQQPEQDRGTEKAFTPSSATLKADEQKQAQQKREGGLAPETDIDNVN